MGETIELPSYEEFAVLEETALEAGVAWRGQPAVARHSVEVTKGRRLSAVVWGTEPPELVLFHGMAQNAHTWDPVALALGRPLIAIDLPGHGHSDWRDDLDYRPSTVAEDLAIVVEQLAPEARLLVGMSMGGLAAIALTARRPDLIPALVLIDITPGIGERRTSVLPAFVREINHFSSFDEILAGARALNPNRTDESLRRAVLHNARPQPDGSWVWRHDLRRGQRPPRDLGALWDDLGAITGPITLVRGSQSPVVSEEDIDELLRRQPRAEVVVVEDAGHNIQSNQPLVLTELIERRLHELSGPAS